MTGGSTPTARVGMATIAREWGRIGCIGFGGGFCFIVPGLVLILALAALFLTGAIAGSAIPLALALQHQWQLGVLAAAATWLLAARRGVVTTLLGAGAIGVVAALADWPVS